MLTGPFNASIRCSPFRVFEVVESSIHPYLPSLAEIPWQLDRRQEFILKRKDYHVCAIDHYMSTEAALTSAEMDLCLGKKAKRA